MEDPRGFPGGAESESCSVMSASLQPHGLQHARLPCPSPTPRAWSTHAHGVGDAHLSHQGSLQVALMVKSLPTNAGDIDVGSSLGWKDPPPVFLPGEFHGQRSLVGYSPWGCKEWDMTKHASRSRKDFRILAAEKLFLSVPREGSCLSYSHLGPLWPLPILLE